MKCYPGYEIYLSAFGTTVHKNAKPEIYKDTEKKQNDLPRLFISSCKVKTKASCEQNCIFARAGMV